MKVKEELIINAFGYVVKIKKGAMTSNRTALGIDENYNFLESIEDVEISYDGNEFFKPSKNDMFTHDFTYYGINIAPQELE